MKNILIVALVMIFQCSLYAEQIYPGFLPPGEFNGSCVSLKNGSTPNLQGLDSVAPEATKINLEKELEMEILERSYIELCA